MALYRDACKVKDMCLRDRKVGYKGLKDTSQTFSCYFASECTHVISLITGLTKENYKENRCACICDQSDYLFCFTSTEIQGAPLCKQMNTFRSKTNNQ